MTVENKKAVIRRNIEESKKRCESVKPLPAGIKGAERIRVITLFNALMNVAGIDEVSPIMDEDQYRGIQALLKDATPETIFNVLHHMDDLKYMERLKDRAGNPNYYDEYVTILSKVNHVYEELRWWGYYGPIEY